MPNTTVAWGSFPTRKAADQAIHRLVASGFARNSIDLKRHEDDEGYDLAVQTRPDNLERVQRLIDASPLRYGLQRVGSGAMQNARSHPYALLGAGIAVGIAVYGLLRASQRSR